eukprot:comp10464_c0_seq1/m.5212 comp10464_c0_seq1/g.5212  ORF comp10464_c0_seq1/g.5212 comp10464_c0_seq1/m.5212 type:complete len:430 (-) comp10464_c0_seq1:127-1416(-)
MTSKMTTQAFRSLSVGVIGAGAAGLCTAKILRDYGHKVTVYEASEGVGGTWVLREGEGDVHSSIYESLHTNLPKDVMEYRDLPFVGSPNTIRFPHHSAVLGYLEEYAKAYDLFSMIRFGNRVSRVEHLSDDVSDWWKKDQWRVTVAEEGRGGVNSSFFTHNAVVICNGHYSKPAYPRIEGMDGFRGKILHSHWYRRPDSFRDQSVVVVGSGASGCDIGRELGGVCRHVYVCVGDHIHAESVAEVATVELVPRLARVTASECIFSDGRTVKADCIVFCTGYDYYFPFLEGTGLDRVIDGNRLEGLYHHVFDVDRPSLAYVGLPFKVVPFPLFEYQAHWIARVFKGTSRLPPSNVMKQENARELKTLELRGLSPKYLHQLGAEQFDYCNMLADMCNENSGDSGDIPVRKVPLATIENYSRSRELRRQTLGY